MIKMKETVLKNFKRSLVSTAVLLICAVAVLPTATAFAGVTCGSGKNAVKTSIDFGCRGEGNPILDMTFAIIRVLSDGVGIVIIGSIIVAGIQYSTSQGDPNASAQAMNRIRSALIALLIFVFAYAILNYVLPGQFLT